MFFWEQFRYLQDQQYYKFNFERFLRTLFHCSDIRVLTFLSLRVPNGLGYADFNHTRAVPVGNQTHTTRTAFHVIAMIHVIHVFLYEYYIRVARFDRAYQFMIAVCSRNDYKAVSGNYIIYVCRT